MTLHTIFMHSQRRVACGGAQSIFHTRTHTPLALPLTDVWIHPRHFETFRRNKMNVGRPTATRESAESDTHTQKKKTAVVICGFSKNKHIHVFGIFSLFFLVALNENQKKKNRFTLQTNYDQWDWRVRLSISWLCESETQSSSTFSIFILSPDVRSHSVR